MLVPDGPLPRDLRWEASSRRGRDGPSRHQRAERAGIVAKPFEPRGVGVDLSATITIERPAAEVFDYVMEVAHDAEWRADVVEAAYTSAPPHDVGATGFDRIDSNGREMTATWTTTEYKPGVFARWTFDSGPVVGSGAYICEQNGHDTRFTLEAHIRPAGWYRLMGPIFGMVARRQNLADVRRLKSILEGTGLPADADRSSSMG